MTDGQGSKTGGAEGAGSGPGAEDTSDTGLPEDADPSILHLSPAERHERGIDDEAVREAFLAVVRYGDADQKDLRGVTLPGLDLDRMLLEGVDRHPVDLRDATIEGPLSLEFSTVRLPIVLDGATIDGLQLDNAHFENELSCTEATVTGEIDGFEALFEKDAHFEDATFEGPVSFDETVFDDDVDFDRATFGATAEFRGAEFHGDSNLLDDNTSFTGATFRALADFRQAEFGFTHFEDATFEDVADFQEATFDGDADFDRATFAALADIDEATFDGDAAFVECVFEGRVDARGATFSGGERALEDDVSFADAVFHDEADFDRAKFRFVSFTDADFRARAGFQETTITADSEFTDARFGAAADFDEARFGSDADFSGVHFEDYCAFRGADFEGGANYLEEDVSFEAARFDANADFHNARFTSANFMDAAFGGAIDFSGATFSERLDFKAADVAEGAFVNCTRAKIVSGKIVQPEVEWTRFDMTLASIGDVDLDAESEADYRRLLDFFRFCRTEFDEFDGQEFDFSAHRDYLDRNAWAIHEFHEPEGVEMEYELPMTAEIIETTYLKAKQAASAVGDMKVAGEFRVKRQEYSRHKNMEVVRDPTTPLWTRIKNFGRASENYFLGVTCGHGMRPIRIALAFVVAPLLYVPFYAFGGPLFAIKGGQTGQIRSLDVLFSAEGLDILFETARFSYISYTTIGYGFLGPVGPAAEVMAASEAYLGVILSALLVYALVKRSEL